VTNDLIDYVGISATPDGTAVVTSRSDQRSSIWIADGDGGRGNEVLPPTADHSTKTLAWAGDRLVFATSPTGSPAIKVMGPDRAVNDVIAQGVDPSATSDGGAIVYTNPFDGSLYRADATGRHSTPLAPGASAAVTPDDHDVVYISAQSGVQSVWAMPLSGGTPRELVHRFAVFPSVSPDGRWLLFTSMDNTQQQGVSIVCRLPDCSEQKTFKPPFKILVARRWVPDNSGFAGVDLASYANIWIQPLDGSPPRQLTHFSDGALIDDFAWSHDGKHLAVARSTTTKDIVLFKGLR
jgi:Tol biopolymer transport system component